MERIGVIGLGRMGTAIAQCWSGWGQKAYRHFELLIQCVFVGQTHGADLHHVQTAGRQRH